MSPQENRKDIFQLDASLQKLASGVVAIFDANIITMTGYGKAILNFPGYYSEQTSPFYNQPLGAVGTGFLVAPGIIATANHILNNYNYVVDRLRFVFGFQIREEGQDLGQIDESEIYFGHLKDVPGFSNDWALIELDSDPPPENNHKILEINWADNIEENTTPVFILGHPLGLPAKFAGDGQIGDVDDPFFFSSLKINEHNSGSPVFNADTKKVEGILLRLSGLCFKACKLPRL